VASTKGMALLALSSAPVQVGDFSLAFVRNISVPKPAYTLLRGNASMTVTSFDAAPIVGKSGVYSVDLLAGGGTASEVGGSSSIDWPNIPVPVDSSVFGFPALLVGAGFLAPTHGDGGMWVMEDAASPEHLPHPVRISQPRVAPAGADWFYHLGVLQDMNGDGLLDVLTSRCHYDAIPTPWSAEKQGVLVWLEQPAADPLGGVPWVEHILAEGPDFQFTPKPSLSRADFGVVAAEYINERLAYYSLSPSGEVTTRVLDSELGPGFGVVYADLDRDGQPDLLATNHLNINGSVSAYTWEGDLADDHVPVTKHVLADGFSAVSAATGTAAPGDAFAFQPRVGRTEKPYILVSGDNMNAVFALVPKDESRGSWEYDKVTLAFLGADIGRPSIGDVDGDGYVELFVPAYDADRVCVFRFGPGAAARGQHV